MRLQPTNHLFALVGFVFWLTLGQTYAAPHEGKYQKNLTHVGKTTGDEILYTLYLPPEYSKEKGPYPLIIFLHGAGGGNSSSDVLQSYEAARKAGAIGDCIVVFPEQYGGTGWRDGGKDKRPETNILKELLPHLESKYALSTDRRQRTIMGFSMGAAGSLYWGSKYLDLFSVAVSLDAGGGNSLDDSSARNYVPDFKKNQEAIREGALQIRLVQGGLQTRGFQAAMKELKIPFDYEQVSRKLENHPKGSPCLNKRRPGRLMLHNPACMTDSTWGRNTWAFIGKAME